jgi:uncharacterized protein (DUF1778 family)
MATVGTATQARVHLPVDPEQQTRLRAAEVDAQAPTGFLLSAAAVRADEVRARSARLEVDADVLDRLVAALQHPAVAAGAGAAPARAARGPSSAE